LLFAGISAQESLKDLELGVAGFSMSGIGFLSATGASPPIESTF
jgi:hypothetical protein